MLHASGGGGALNRNWLRMPPLIGGNGRSSGTSARFAVLSSSSLIFENPLRVQRHPTNEERSARWGGGSGLAHLAPGARAEARRRHAWDAVTVLMAAGGVKQRGRSFPLTSSITLEERKRGSNATAHQYTSHPRFRPAGLYG